MNGSQSLIMVLVMAAIVAAFVFESAKAILRENNHPCICGHKYSGLGPDSHVRKGDADSEWFAPGEGQRKVGTCRGCRCRTFISKL